MSNKNIKYASYTQISPERDVTSNGFSKGQINFKMQMDSMSRWNPYRSYLRMRIRLSKASNDPLNIRDGIAPNMFQGDCFWQQMDAKCNGVRVSEIDDYVAQTSSLRQRFSLTESSRKDFLSTTNFAQSCLKERISEVSEDGLKLGNYDWVRFTDLHQNDGTLIQDDDQIKVEVANLSLIQYTDNTGNNGTGSIDLTQSDLQICDQLRFTQTNNVGEVRTITAITASSITVNKNLTVFAAEDIVRIAGTGACGIYYSKSKPSRNVKDYELCYRPCMGLFSIDDYLPGNWKIELIPHTNLKYQRYAFESLLDRVPDTDYKLEVIDLQLYIWKGRVNKPMNGPEEYNFTEIRCQAQTITSNSLLNKAFVVNKNSHTFTIAYQKPDAGDDTRFSKTKFRMLNDYEKRIQRYQLRINGETLPTPLPDIDTDAANNKDFATQQYYEQLHYNGTIYLDDPENLNDWFERGPYYSYRLPKKLNAESNRLYVSSEFAIVQPENFLLLVFDHYYKGFKLDLENGLVSNVEKDIMIN